MTERSIVYFEKPGRQNTDETLRLVDRRVAEGDIVAVAVATTTGATALRARELVTDKAVPVLGICFQAHASYDPPQADIRAKAEGLGVRFLPEDPIVTYVHEIPGESADTLRKFGQGIKVAVEVVLMAAEAGMVEEGARIIGIGGTSQGADAAVVARAATPENVKSLWIHEVLCKPG